MVSGESSRTPEHTEQSEHTENPRNNPTSKRGFMQWMYSKKEGTSKIDQKNLNDVRKAIIDPNLKKAKEDFRGIIENMKGDYRALRDIDQGIDKELESAQLGGRDPVALKSEDAARITDAFQQLDQHRESAKTSISKAAQLRVDFTQSFSTELKEGKLADNDIDDATKAIDAFLKDGRKTLNETYQACKKYYRNIYNKGTLGRDIDTDLLIQPRFQKIHTDLAGIINDMNKDYDKVKEIYERTNTELLSARDEGRNPVILKREDASQIITVYQKLDEHIKRGEECLSEVRQLNTEYNRISDDKVKEGKLDKNIVKEDNEAIEKILNEGHKILTAASSEYKGRYRKTYEGGTRATLKTPGRNIDQDILFEAWTGDTLLEGGTLPETDPAPGAASPG